MANVKLTEAHLGGAELRAIGDMLDAIPAQMIFEGDLTLYDDNGEAHVVGVHYDLEQSYHYIVVKNGLGAEKNGNSTSVVHGTD